MMSWKSVAATLSQRRRELLLALGIVLATVLSFVIASGLHLAQPYWSVITAAIVARTTATGAVRSGFQRLLGTLAGAALGFFAALGRGSGLSDVVLLTLLVAPLAVAAALRLELRAALVAGLIVFSTTAAPAAPAEAAMARILEVSLGAIVAALVSLGLAIVARQ